MSDINFCNTKEQLNHLGEVVTGKVDGSPTGADIDTSTLPYTGQVRKTLPALEEEYQTDIDNFVQVSDQLIVDKTAEFDAAVDSFIQESDQVITDKSAEFDVSIANKEAEADAAIDSYRLLNKGPYASGITLESKFEYITYNGESYFATNPPYTTTATLPDADDNLFIGNYITSDFGLVTSGTQVKHRRGTNAEILAGTPAIGELWFNTTDNTIHMGDGVTLGGIKHARVSDVILQSPDVNHVLNRKDLKEGFVVNVREGDINFDVVDSSTVTPDGKAIFESIFNPALSIVMNDDVVFGNGIISRSINGAHSYYRANPDFWTDDLASRFYVEPVADVVAAETGAGGVIKVFSVPFSNGGLPYYQDLGIYYYADQEGDTGYYDKGVFYINSKAVGVNNPDIAVTFQDGIYQAFKSTLLPGTSQGGNRAVTVFGKRNSTTAEFLDKTVQEINGWIGFDLGSSGLAWWGVLQQFSSKLNVIDSADFTDTDELNWSGNNQSILQISKERTRIKNGLGDIILEILNGGSTQGVKAETRVVGRQATVTSGSFSVAGMNSAVLNFAGATTVTTLSDGIPGQIVTLIAGNGNATIEHNATIRLKSGANYALPAETGISLCWSGVHNKWFEVASSA